ncbi:MULTISPECIES: hypothetical protein [Microterricola]|uniref:Uncharacterized protein n=1 Tax=Microterricola viridarii TaxID=412690 RepID=A0A1H1QF86_9MICO|nr:MULTISPECIES: hypothetical protein [Microterricola]SDS22095.1 hypothetical protein SAMN04489834_1079 [Microterricola viridarii]
MDYALIENLFRIGIFGFAGVMILVGLGCLVALARAPYRKK